MKFDYKLSPFYVFLSVGLILFSMYQLVDGDEGCYLTALRLTAEGQLPFIDTFFTQGPYWLLFYLPTEWLFGPSFLAHRLTSVAYVILGWFFILKSQKGRDISFSEGIILCLFVFYFYYAVLIKTYAVSTFLIGLQYWFFSRSRESLKRVGVFGALTAVSMWVRPFHLATAIASLFLMRSSSLRKLSVWALGGLLISFPALLFVFFNWEAVQFGLLEYHSLREVAPAGWERVQSIALFFWRLITLRPEVVPLLAVLIWALARYRNLSELARLSTLSSVFFFALSLTPWPIYFQYFTATLLPLLFPVIREEVIPRLLVLPRRVRVALMVMGLTHSAYVTTEHIWRIQDVSPWSRSHIEQVVEKVKSHTQVGDPVFSTWAGFSYLANRRDVEGMENHFIFRIVNKLSPEEIAALPLSSVQVILDRIDESPPAAVVLGLWDKDFFGAMTELEKIRLNQWLSENYRLEWSARETRVYIRH